MHNRRWILFCNTYEQHYSLYSLMEKNDNHINEQANLSAFPIWQQLLRTYFQWHKYYYHFFLSDFLSNAQKSAHINYVCNVRGLGICFWLKKMILTLISRWYFITLSFIKKGHRNDMIIIFFSTRRYIR